MMMMMMMMMMMAMMMVMMMMMMMMMMIIIITTIMIIIIMMIIIIIILTIRSGVYQSLRLCYRLKIVTDDECCHLPEITFHLVTNWEIKMTAYKLRVLIENAITIETRSCPPVSSNFGP